MLGLRVDGRGGSADDGRQLRAASHDPGRYAPRVGEGIAQGSERKLEAAILAPKPAAASSAGALGTAVLGVRRIMAPHGSAAGGVTGAGALERTPRRWS